MALRLQSTTLSDLDAVVEALVTGFSVTPDAPFVDRRLLLWKYFEPGPRWEGTRSYLLKEGDAVRAHCGVSPMNLGFAGGIVTCLCFTDWVGSQRFPGAGVLLKQKIMGFAQTAVVVGGSADTRAIIPRLNYKDAGNVGVFVRVVRLWKQFRTRPKEGIGKEVARLARNAMWSHKPAMAIPEDWSAVRLQSFDSVSPRLESVFVHASDAGTIRGLFELLASLSGCQDCRVCNLEKKSDPRLFPADAN